MKIRYDGPGNFVNVAPFGRHLQGEIKEYPDEFGEELLATSSWQKFNVVGGDETPSTSKGKKTGKGKKRSKDTPAGTESTPPAGEGEPSENQE